jgi:hypothetical protein
MRERVLRIVLLVAACFAIGSVGFFIAVLLQRTAAPTASVQTIQPVAEDISTSTKEAILQSMSNSSDGVTSTSSAGGSATSTGISGQGDNADAQAAAKLKILQAMSAH